jgi:putative sigma-54 modulation protein
MARHGPHRSVIAMKLLVTGRKVDITPALRQLIERKLVRAQRLLSDTAVSAQVILRVEKYRRVADVTIHARGDHMLHGIGEDQDWAGAVKGAIDKIAQQATKLKSKWNTRKRRAGGTKTLEPATVATAEPAEGKRVIRASRYVVKPMTVEDAALCVQDTGETFVVFRNAASDSVNILYRRRDGNLGLIETDADS